MLAVPIYFFLKADYLGNYNCFTNITLNFELSSSTQTQDANYKKRNLTFARGCPTVCVTCVWAGWDSVREQEKLEARRMPENAAESHTSGARGVGQPACLLKPLIEKTVTISKGVPFTRNLAFPENYFVGYALRF